MPPKSCKKYTLKQIIKKAADVNLNTAIALSKSLKDEEKAKIRRAKEENTIPFHLMQDPKEVTRTLDSRLSQEILQPYVVKLTNSDSSNKTRLWNKASLTYDMFDGDLSFGNINMSELLEYYVPSLMPPLSPTMIRMGDKMLNMSLIEGRERSFLFTKRPKPKPEHPINDKESSKSFLFTENSEEKIVHSINNGFSTPILFTEGPDLGPEHSIEYFHLNYGDTVHSVKSKSYHEELKDIIDVTQTEGSGVNISEIKDERQSDIKDVSRFMKMFNYHKHSDLLLLLKSGNILFLHKFVLESWMCNEEILKEPQLFVLDIEDEIVFKVFKHLYSDGKFDIADIIKTDDCQKLCKMFGLNLSPLVQSENQKSTESIEISPKISSDFETVNDSSNQNLTEYYSPEPLKMISPSLNERHSSDFDVKENQLSEKNYQVPVVQSELCLNKPETSLDSVSNDCASSKVDGLEKSFVFPTPIKQDDSKDEIVPENLSEIDLFDSFSNISFSVNINSSIDQSVLKDNKEDVEFKESPINLGECNHEQILLEQQLEIKDSEMDSKDVAEKIAVSNDENVIFMDEAYVVCPERRDDSSVNSECAVKHLETEETTTFLFHSPILNNISSANLVYESAAVDLTSFGSLVGKRLKLDFNDSPLPLLKRIGLKTKTQDGKVTVIISSSDEESGKFTKTDQSELPKLKARQSKDSVTVDEVENVSKPTGSSMKRKSKDLKSESLKQMKTLTKQASKDEESVEKIEERLSKPKRAPVKRKSKDKDSIGNGEEDMSKLKKPPTKRKSKDTKTNDKVKKICVTPDKQKTIFNPFTPMPNYREMPLKSLEDQCKKYGLRSTFPRDKLVGMLEKLYLHFRQVDTDTEVISSSESSDNSGYHSPSDNNSCSSKDEKNEIVDLNDNEQFLLYMKQTYFKEILTYTPLDINQIQAELKANGIIASLKTLNDFCDHQCILLINKKDKLFSRPMKASKLVM